MLISRPQTSKLGGLHHLCILIILVCCRISFAQTPLSGDYTIDSDEATGGTNFNSFTDAVNTLNTNGVSGPVVIDVLPELNTGFFTEQITLKEIPGASATNTITFRSQTGNPDDVVLRYNAAGIGDNWVVQLDSADYIIFQNLTISATNTALARVFYIRNEANNNSITGCKLNSVPTTSGSIFTSIIYLAASGTQANNNNTITSNIFTDGSYGINWEGSSSTPSSGNEIKNNTFNKQYKTAVFLRSQDAPNLEGNQITHQSSDTGYRGMHLKDCVNAITIIKTRLNISNGRGCWIEDCTGTSQDQGLIANNFLFTNGSSSDELVKIEDSHYQNVYFNSFLNTANNSDCLAITGGSTNIAMMNNIVVHQSSGSAYNVGSDTSVTSSNYNNFHTNGNTLARWNSVSHSSLSALQNASGMDGNSSSATVTFANSFTGDLHLFGQSIGDQSLGGTPIASITDDLDGEARDIFFPYMGADENLQSPLPVELTSFTAQANKNQVTLNWTTASETNNFGFEVQRQAITNAWAKIDFVEGHGTTTEPNSYEFIDSDVQNGHYGYRLKQIDTNGDFSFSRVLNVEVTSPNDFQLGQNYPNPFNPSTAINYSIKIAGRVELKIYDLLGKEVRTLVNQHRTAGAYSATWDSKDDFGKQAVSGYYFYRLKSGGSQLTRRMILLR